MRRSIFFYVGGVIEDLTIRAIVVPPKSLALSIAPVCFANAHDVQFVIRAVHKTSSMDHEKKGTRCEMDESFK